MSLPERWVDRIFSRLTVVYGTEFTRRWEGLDVAEVKADWARELTGFQQSPRAIGYALENLPTSKPPNVLEFRAICLRGVHDNATAITYTPAPADPERVAAEFAKIRPQSQDNADMKAWARRLQARDADGEKLNQNQIRCYKNALGLHPNGAQL